MQSFFNLTSVRNKNTSKQLEIFWWIHTKTFCHSSHCHNVILKFHSHNPFHLQTHTSLISPLILWPLSRQPWPNFSSTNAKSQDMRMLHASETGKVMWSTLKLHICLALNLVAAQTLNLLSVLHLTTLCDCIHVHHKQGLRHLPKQVFPSLTH